MEKAMAPHSSTLAWKIPWTEEPGGLQSMGWLGIRHNWATSLSRIGDGNGNPLQCSCLENPRDGGPWWAAIYGVAQSRIQLQRLSSSSRNKEGILPSTRGAIVSPLCSQYRSQSDPLEMEVWICYFSGQKCPVADLRSLWRPARTKMPWSSFLLNICSLPSRQDLQPENANHLSPTAGT